MRACVGGMCGAWQGKGQARRGVKQAWMPSFTHVHSAVQQREKGGRRVFLPELLTDKRIYNSLGRAWLGDCHGERKAVQANKGV